MGGAQEGSLNNTIEPNDTGVGKIQRALLGVTRCLPDGEGMLCQAYDILGARCLWPN